MIKQELRPADFDFYPMQARRLATDHISILKELPPVLCALLLKEISQYDWQFPAERSDLMKQLKWFETADRSDVKSIIAPFAALRVSDLVLALPWSRQPELFLERLTTDLWMTHSIEAFRAAGKTYGDLVQSLRTEGAATESRLCIVLMGAGSTRGEQPLFEKLRPYGTYFRSVDSSEALSQAIEAVKGEVGVNSAPYRHWYVDGASSAPDIQASDLESGGIHYVSYTHSAPMRSSVVQAMNRARTSGIAGPEQLRTLLAQTHLEDPALGGYQDEVMRNFILRLYTEGSGTQIFSTTFVQWAGREILRRARPQSLLLRFRLRQAERPMDELFLGDSSLSQVDPRGSLIDADMGAFYTWINFQRLAGTDCCRFIVCLENGSEAFAAGPGLPKGSISDSSCTLRSILTWAA